MTKEEFKFEIPDYTQATVTNLLRNYLDIRSTITDRMPKSSKPLYTTVVEHTFRERPMGSTPTQPWPFMSKQRAPSMIDGKRRARMMEDLHVAALDLECALNTLSADDFQLVADYFILGNGTIEELAAARGLSSKGRLQERLQRIVRRLVRQLNG